MAAPGVRTKNYALLACLTFLVVTTEGRMWHPSDPHIPFCVNDTTTLHDTTMSLQHDMRRGQLYQRGDVHHIRGEESQGPPLVPQCGAGVHSDNQE